MGRILGILYAKYLTIEIVLNTFETSQVQEMCYTFLSISLSRVTAELRINKNVLKEGRYGNTKSLNDVSHLIAAGMEQIGNSEFPQTTPRIDRFKAYERIFLDNKITWPT